MRTYSTRTVICFCCCFLLAHLFGQAKRPDFSGKWKVNVAKSRYIKPHKGGAETYKIKQTDRRLEVTRRSDFGIDTYYHTLDGKEEPQLSDPEGLKLRTKAYWDGDTLVIETKQDINSKETRSMGRYALSADGQLLTINSHVFESFLSGAFDQMIVLERQK